MSFDPATVAAFVDGELDDLTARRIEREAATDAALAAEIARHRALKTRLTAHYAPIAEEAVPERFRSLLAVDNKVDTSLTDRRNARRARFSGMHWGTIAASLILGLMIGLRPWVPGAEVAIDGGTLVAAGPLAEALDTQLASSQPGDAAVRIVLSFEDKAGRYCRSFESRAIDGIGCREQDRWQIERTLPGQTRGDYRQASSGELAAAAAAMMKRGALDARAERAARDAGWAQRR
ncbi:anti-sigma factor [Sphingopyxis sp.]|uniref:anti-sigma factor n=1 Tax=Sphingopyxis sp. TaxID=1908224 RepID=UPI002D7887EB|nr:anti-sigma factor [Sphingopyxis sp.]HET6526038.1 anti-sigma factor [Sphingopyxis sp.]